MPVCWTKMTREKQILLFSIERNGETSWTSGVVFLLLFVFVPAMAWIITILFDARDSIPNECKCFYIDLVFVLLFSEYVIVAQCITLAFPRSHSRLGSIRLISCQLLCTDNSEVRILPHSFHFISWNFASFRFTGLVWLITDSDSMPTALPL